MELPTINYRGLRWFVDVPLNELRQADTWDLTPLKFSEFREHASDAECDSLDEAIMIYRMKRGM